MLGSPHSVITIELYRVLFPNYEPANFDYFGVAIVPLSVISEYTQIDTEEALYHPCYVCLVAQCIALWSKLMVVCRL